MQEKAFVIYGLADPDTGIVRYIGKTSGDPRVRHRSHVTGNSPGTKQWVESLSGPPFLLVLEEGTEGLLKRLSGTGYTPKSRFAETKWIKRFRRTIINKGLRDNAPLVWDYLKNPDETEAA